MEGKRDHQTSDLLADWASLPIAILVNNDMQPRARARHAHLGYASLPFGLDAGDGGENAEGHAI